MGTSSSKLKEPKKLHIEYPEQYFRTILVAGVNRSGKSTLCNGLANAPIATSCTGDNFGANTSETAEFLVNYHGRTYKLVDTPDVADTGAIVESMCAEGWSQYNKDVGCRKKRLLLSAIFFTCHDADWVKFKWLIKVINTMDPENVVKMTILFKPTAARGTPEEIQYTKEQIISELSQESLENVEVMQNKGLKARAAATMGTPWPLNENFFNNLWETRIPCYQHAPITRIPYWSQVSKFFREIEIKAVGAGERTTNLPPWTYFAEKPLLEHQKRRLEPDPSEVKYSDVKVHYEECLYVVRDKKVAAERLSYYAVPGTKQKYTDTYLKQSFDIYRLYKADFTSNKNGELKERIYRRVHFMEVSKDPREKTWWIQPDANQIFDAPKSSSLINNENRKSDLLATCIGQVAKPIQCSEINLYQYNVGLERYFRYRNYCYGPARIFMRNLNIKDETQAMKAVHHLRCNIEDFTKIFIHRKRCVIFEEFSSYFLNEACDRRRSINILDDQSFHESWNETFLDHDRWIPTGQNYDGHSYTLSQDERKFIKFGQSCSENEITVSKEAYIELYILQQSINTWYNHRFEKDKDCFVWNKDECPMDIKAEIDAMGRRLYRDLSQLPLSTPESGAPVAPN